MTIEKDIIKYKEKIKELEKILDASVSKGTIEEDFLDEIEKMKKMEREIMNNLLPVYRKQRIYKTKIYFKKCNSEGVFKPEGFVEKNVKVDNNLYCVFTSKGEVCTYSLEGEKIKWISNKKIEDVEKFKDIFPEYKEDGESTLYTEYEKTENLNTLYGENTYIKIKEDGYISVFEEFNGEYFKNQKTIEGFFIGGNCIEKDNYIVFDLDNNGYFIKINVINSVEKIMEEGIQL